MNINQRVVIKDFDTHKSPAKTGKVVGTGSMVSGDSIHNMFLVKLDQGFYCPAKQTYINVVVVHPDGLIEL